MQEDIKIITPVKKLLKGTKEVGLGDLEISIPHKLQDGMKTLIDGFNAMVENLKKHQQDLADMSKKTAWAEMAASSQTHPDEGDLEDTKSFAKWVMTLSAQD